MLSAEVMMFVQSFLLAFALALSGQDASANAGRHASPNKAPYPVAHGAALGASQRFVDREGQQIRYRVEFNGVRGDRVPGYLYVPQDGRHTHPTVMVQYGSGASKDTPYIVRLARRFADHGFEALTIDIPLRGERTPKSTGRWSALATQFNRFDRETFAQTCGDYSRAVDYLQTRPEVDVGRLAYVGISWGAITGITFAAYEPRIRAFVSLVGGGGFVAKVLGGNEEANQDLDPVHQVARIAPRPILFINATKDQMIARPFAEALHKAAGPNAKVVWVDTDHEFRGTDRDKVAHTVVQFVEESLGRK